MRRLALCAVLLAGCGGGPTPPPSTPGDLLVTYSPGNFEAGALLLTITGGKVDNVSAVGAQQVTFTGTVPGTIRVLVIGAIVSGDLIRIRVPDLSLSADYQVRIDQVADKNTFSLIDPAGYATAVHR
ncbi:MAG: hypothetical protein HOP28_02250 [Gemmatimonadales bacterium]|nr:hypothetical protein [Gemmatimonadales bacterium]